MNGSVFMVSIKQNNHQTGKSAMCCLAPFISLCWDGASVPSTLSSHLPQENRWLKFLSNKWACSLLIYIFFLISSFTILFRAYLETTLYGRKIFRTFLLISNIRFQITYIPISIWFSVLSDSYMGNLSCFLIDGTELK